MRSDGSRRASQDSDKLCDPLISGQDASHTGWDKEDCNVQLQSEKWEMLFVVLENGVLIRARAMSQCLTKRLSASNFSVRIQTLPRPLRYMPKPTRIGMHQMR